MYLTIVLWLLFLTGLYSACEHPRCHFDCQAEHASDRNDMNWCLELCHRQYCNDTDDTGGNDDRNTVKKAVAKYFSVPSRWIPTVIGSIVGVGIICVIVYYTRKSWKRRDRFPSYGFSRLRKGRNDPSTHTDMTELSDVGR